MPRVSSDNNLHDMPVYFLGKSGAGVCVWDGGGGGRMWEKNISNCRPPNLLTIILSATLSQDVG